MSYLLHIAILYFKENCITSTVYFPWCSVIIPLHFLPPRVTKTKYSKVCCILFLRILLYLLLNIYIFIKIHCIFGILKLWVISKLLAFFFNISFIWFMNIDTFCIVHLSSLLQVIIINRFLYPFSYWGTNVSKWLPAQIRLQ